MTRASFCLFFLAAWWSLARPLPAAELVHLGQGGVEVDAGSLGQFTMEYPALLDAKQQPLRKLIDKAIAGTTATLRYEGGTQLELAVGEGGTVRVHVSQPPAELKFLELNMHIPISFNQGGRWKLGPKEGDFPKEKPATPHLFQGNAAALEMTNYEGRTLVVTPPEYSYLQLTDNREWNWAIFHLKTITPFAPERKELTLSFRTVGAAGKAPPLVDEFGQNAREEWPGKIHRVEELKADAAAEREDRLYPIGRDDFGGLEGYQAESDLQATGFFHLQQKGERALLVDPAGKLFFHLGLCSVSPGEDYTLVKGRESAFAWLPPREGEYATAWLKESNGTIVSFQLANMIRKYGEPYDRDRYTARMIDRMKQWGFNSLGAFSGASEAAQETASFPAVAHLPLGSWEVPHLPGIGQVWDPFDEKTRAKVEANFARVLPPRAKNPLVIGYFMANEPIYENIPHLVPTFKGSEHACKHRLVQGLEKKYATVAAFNAAWQLSAKTFPELEEMVLPVESAAAKADVQEFSTAFLEEMARFVAETFHRFDQNHLLLGSRIMPGTIKNEWVCRALGQYVDVLSFNYYTDGVDLKLLRQVHEWTGGRPFMLSEFYWSAAKESGLTGGREVSTQRERGLAYRNYVEQSAASGMVIGIEWFTLNDQAVTGRSFEGLNGERANTGVLAVTDRPWKEALSGMKLTNWQIYDVLQKRRPPFTWENPKFKTVP